ncbi:spore germination protein [Aquibacillus koreensis]|uniref:Spore germination protein n=1 Tax=Aquibacillus koreensis TaxID=279446 RepID=A0A9X3WME0_9BACI|nr:spore germination protein [Aquibacillus koreensis]MCT2536970.1 spore germination protein [Aquibacillus koreensis]MDC3422727.1 spore germination protein [Aquibacillus koreensis]
MFHFFKKAKKANTQSKPQKNNDPIRSSLKHNTEHIKQLFSYGTNKDFSYRDLIAKYNQKEMSLFYYSSIVNGDKIYEAIIRPLLEAEGNELKNVVTVESLTEIKDFDEVIEHINSGKAILFQEGTAIAFSIDVAQFQFRSIGKAENESAIKGPQEAFTESLNVNISLVRKRVHDKQLITESKQVGKRSKSEVNFLYVSDLVNDDILNNLKKRLDEINTDSVRNVELLEQYIEERPYSIFPSIHYTERPDKAASYLEDGYIIILMDNSAACLVVPVTFWSFFHAQEDRYLRFLYGNFTRAIRLFAFYLTTMISATYVGITNFHSEMLPPDLLLAITASRERVPFPLIFEVLIMEVAFELIREAGIRIPNPLGPTIGIVGALILGQAAVEANIISPIIVIVAAVSGLTSFAIADVSINFTVRITRFIFIAAAGTYGMFGLAGAFLVWFMYAASLKSFGVPFFSPLAPYFKSPGDTVFRKAIKNEIWRPGNLLPKDLRKKRDSTSK